MPQLNIQSLVFFQPPESISYSSIYASVHKPCKAFYCWCEGTQLDNWSSLLCL